MWITVTRATILRGFSLRVKIAYPLLVEVVSELVGYELDEPTVGPVP
jgi:hypothetical protein